MSSQRRCLLGVVLHLLMQIVGDVSLQLGERCLRREGTHRTHHIEFDLCGELTSPPASLGAKERSFLPSGPKAMSRRSSRVGRIEEPSSCEPNAALLTLPGSPSIPYSYLLRMSQFRAEGEKGEGDESLSRGAQREE